jgi:hypothetical protein
MPSGIHADNSPVAIGGVGGSGTRLVAAVLARTGTYIGSDLNEALDNLWFTLLFKRIELWSAPSGEFARMLRIFRAAMAEARAFEPGEREAVEMLAAADRLQHAADWLATRARALLASERIERAIWGWKEPNTHIFLDRLAESFPRLRYIHVMRNGLDMALSSNQNQLQLWGAALLGRPVAMTPRDSLSYWCAVHRRVQALGGAMGERFLLLNYDALCASPEHGLRRLLAFLGVPVDAALLAELVALVRPPTSIGRYREHGIGGFDPDDVAYVAALGFDTGP